MSRSKVIGTRAESRVVRYLRDHGFKDADRLALHGNKDIGDVATGTPCNLEIKAGEQARNVCRSRLGRWLDEAETETENLPEGKLCLLCIVEPGRPIRDAKVYRRNADGSMSMIYFDLFVSRLYLEHYACEAGENSEADA